MDTVVKDIIKNPTLEILAIMLFEHDTPAKHNLIWLELQPSDREMYRKMASGAIALPTK